MTLDAIHELLMDGRLAHATDELIVYVERMETEHAEQMAAAEQRINRFLRDYERRLNVIEMTTNER